MCYLDDTAGAVCGQICRVSRRDAGKTGYGA
jgi:hypothetical protein